MQVIHLVINYLLCFINNGCFANIEIIFLFYNNVEQSVLEVTLFNLKSNKMSKTSTRVRDARTGQFVPSREATRRPATTVTEKIKVGPVKKRS